MNKEELKSCPFCGGKAEIKDMGSNRLHIYCKKCNCHVGEIWGDAETEDELIKAWNTRPQAVTEGVNREDYIKKYGHNDHFTSRENNIRKHCREAIEWALQHQEPQQGYGTLPEPNSPKNWVEDYNGGENQYICTCIKCKQSFYGYKRRVLCKECEIDTVEQEEGKEE